MIQGSRIEQREVDAAKAQRDNGRIALFDNSMAWISYNPSGKNADTKASRRVPATNEIDWTADNVPCLATSPGG